MPALIHPDATDETTAGQPGKVTPTAATEPACDECPRAGTGRLRLPVPHGHSRPIRVLHLINGEHYAGAERVQDLLCQRLPDFGVEPALACLKPGRFPESRRCQDTPLYRLPMRGRCDLRPAWQLARLLRRERFDILHTHTPRSALIGRLATMLTPTPLVHYVHGQTALEVRGRWWTRLMARLERSALARAAAVVAVSPSAADYLAEQGFDEARLHVVPNGVPARPALPERTAPAGRWTLGLVALLRPRKGLETVLEAVAQLRAAGDDVRLRVVGSFETPEYEREIHDRASQLGIGSAIEWAGFSANVDAELAQLDVLAFPSLLAEGMPMVVLEAMAAGVPLVASRVPGVTDVLRDGIDALLTAPGDSSALAAAIGRLIRGEVAWHELRASAYCRQRMLYSDRAMASSIAELYQVILQSRPC